jgi:cellobiose phosphorylase
MVGCVEGILGMRPDFYGLHVEPSVPEDWDEFEMEKDFRGKHLHILVKNPNHAQSGCREMRINGKVVEGSYIPEELMTLQTEVEYYMS